MSDFKPPITRSNRLQVFPGVDSLRHDEVFGPLMKARETRRALALKKMKEQRNDRSA